MRSENRLFERGCAKEWVECFPLGNGNIGVMDNGNIEKTLITLNDDRLWSGNGRKKEMPVNTKLKEIRELVADYKYNDAENLIKQHMLGEYTECYLPLADLTIECKSAKFNNYIRELDMEKGVHRVSYQNEDGSFARTSFVSKVDGCYCLKLSSTYQSNYIINLSSKLKYSNYVEESLGGLSIEIFGNAPAVGEPVGHSSNEPIRYDEINPGKEFVVKMVINTDGVLTLSQGNIHANGCSDLNIYICSDIDFNTKRDLIYDINQKISRVVKKGFINLYKAHIADFSALYNRCVLDLGGEENELTTSELLIKNSRNPNNKLHTTLFNLGKYLMISGSREGSSAMNLQGIWNEQMQAPWSSNYTININTQMNYWPVNLLGLHECHLPFFELIKKIAQNGKNTAKNTFNANGWAVGHNSDGWGQANLVGGMGDGNTVAYGLFVGGAGWLCIHIWEHYLFTQDEKFLSDNFGLLYDCVSFYLDYLYLDNESGRYVCSPSASPENWFKERGWHCVNKASTMDMSIIRNLFNAFLSASEILEFDDDITKKTKELLSKLYPYKINRHGRLMEWYYDMKETDKHHRHLSHLFGIYPAYDINFTDTPQLVEACRNSLNRRGLDGTGWAKAWKINLYARLKDGETALKCLNGQLQYVDASPKRKSWEGGSYASLLCAHPPFQIDGNFGATAGIIEMLIQSHEGFIEFLPALPKAWKNGSLRGVRARGGYTVDFEWKNYLITDYKITSKKGGCLKLKVNGKMIDFEPSKPE